MLLLLIDNLTTRVNIVTQGLIYPLNGLSLTKYDFI
jgi:hypothetical protein